MTANDRFDQRFGALLDDLAAPNYPDYFDDVLERATRGAQRPAWTFPERWLPVSVLARRPAFAPALPWRTVGLLVILALLLAAILVVTVGSKRLPAPFGLAENGLLTYSANGDLYLRDDVTGEPRLLLGGSTQDVSPIFSRDGTKFAFIRIHGSGPKGDVGELLVANADGSNIRSLAGPEVEPYWWEWSPSGKEIAINSKANGVDQLSVVNVEGEPVRRQLELEVTPHAVWWRPPLGDELIFQGRMLNEYAIYGVRPDGTGLRRITRPGPESDYMWPFSLSPDGSQLAYTRGGDEAKVHFLDIDTGEDRIFGTKLPQPAADIGGGWVQDGSAAFAPDGEHVVFERSWNDRNERILHQLWVASADGDGSDAVPVGQPVRNEPGGNPFGVTFSPDGKSIIFSRSDTRRLYIADQAGGGTAELSWDTADLPDWQRLAPRR